MEASGNGERWLFSAQALFEMRKRSHDATVEAMTNGANEKKTAKLSQEEEERMVQFCAQKLLEKCELCGAPQEVLWTALVFYRRFFATRSPMEFDPVPMMFACVHLACKIEEVHEITMDRLLGAGESADDGAVKKIRDQAVAFELPLLDGIGFQLLVEPKPDSCVEMLVGELQRSLASLSSPPKISEPTWEALTKDAERLAVELAVRTDAVLRWPASALIAAALRASAQGVGPMGAPAPAEGRPGIGKAASSALIGALDELLYSQLVSEPQRAAARSMMEGIAERIRELALSEAVSEELWREARKGAKKCHKAFDRLRDEAAKQNDLSQKERKRKWNEVKGAQRRQAEQNAAPPNVGVSRKLDLDGEDDEQILDPWADDDGMTA